MGQKITKELLDTNDFRIFGLAWNCRGMTDNIESDAVTLEKDAYEPLIFMKDKNSITTEINIHIPFCEKDVVVWGEPELCVIFDEASKIVTTVIVNDVTILHNNSDRDHHLPINKSIRRTFAIQPIYELYKTFDTKYTTCLMGSIFSTDNKCCTLDRFGYLRDLIWIDPNNVNQHIRKYFGVFQGLTLISFGTVPVVTCNPQKVAEPHYIHCCESYCCVVDGFGSLFNKFHFQNTEGQKGLKNV